MPSCLESGSHVGATGGTFGSAGRNSGSAIIADKTANRADRTFAQTQPTLNNLLRVPNVFEGNPSAICRIEIDISYAAQPSKS
jgi:hypothetical protein